MTAPLFDGLAPLGPDDAANECILRVALPVPLDQLFDYRLPARLSAAHTEVRPGTRVRIPFAGQLLVGLVVPNDLMADERDEALPALAEIQAIIDEEPVVSESMIRILADAAREIFAPIGLAVAHALPPGSSPRTARDRKSVV